MRSLSLSSNAWNKYRMYSLGSAIRLRYFIIIDLKIFSKLSYFQTRKYWRNSGAETFGSRSPWGISGNYGNYIDSEAFNAPPLLRGGAVRFIAQPEATTTHLLERSVELLELAAREVRLLLELIEVVRLQVRPDVEQLLVRLLCNWRAITVGYCWKRYGTSIPSKVQFL